MAAIASDLKPAADGNKEYDTNASKPVVKDNTSHLSPQDRPSNTHSRSLDCLWCDSYEHLQDRCKELAHAINTGKVLYNSKRIINAITGKEFAPRIGRGGMRIHLQLQKTWSASTSSGAASSTPASSSSSLPSVKHPVISRVLSWDPIPPIDRF